MDKKSGLFYTLRLRSFFLRVCCCRCYLFNTAVVGHKHTMQFIILCGSILLGSLHVCTLLNAPSLVTGQWTIPVSDRHMPLSGATVNHTRTFSTFCKDTIITSNACSGSCRTSVPLIAAWVGHSHLSFYVNCILAIEIITICAGAQRGRNE